MTSKESGIAALERAMDIVMLFQQEKRELGVTEISRLLGLHKSTVHRCLNTLERRGFVQQNPATSRYWLGIKFYILGSLYTEKMSLCPIASPFIQELANQLNEAVHLAVLDRFCGENLQVIVIDKVETRQRLSITPSIGSGAPVHCCGVGKAMMAFAGEEILNKLLQYPFTPFTVHTITDRDTFLQELEKIRSQGYAVDRDELEMGLTCVAAPIFNHRGEVVAAVSTSGPTTRMVATLEQKIIPSVKQIAGRISSRLK